MDGKIDDRQSDPFMGLNFTGTTKTTHIIVHFVYMETLYNSMIQYKYDHLFILNFTVLMLHTSPFHNKVMNFSIYCIIDGPFWHLFMSVTGSC